jgi:mevalonate kinase
MLVKASAPGSLMLLGEHAVLQGKHALVCAIDKRMTVTLAARSDSNIHITSALGNLQTDLANLEVAAPFQFVIAALKKFRPTSGFDITIESGFSDKIGFSSSAAVTVAMVAALSKILKVDGDLIRKARSIVREVQGLGSGADVAACVLGGIVSYKMQPMLAEKISHQYPLTAVYAGYKTPTVDVVKKVKTSFEQQPELFQQLCEAIDACAVQGAQFVRDQNWQGLGKMMNTQQGLMESLGVNTPQLSRIVHDLRGKPDVLGSKISGSGLGDCVIALGKIADFTCLDQEKLIPVAITSTGVCCEEI